VAGGGDCCPLLSPTITTCFLGLVVVVVVVVVAVVVVVVVIVVVVRVMRLRKPSR